MLPKWTPQDYPYTQVPYKHQLDALERGGMRPFYAYLFEQGCGKTKVTLDNLGILFSNGMVNRALILTPGAGYLNWSENELPKHIPAPIKAVMKTHVWDGATSKTELAKLREFVKAGPPTELKVLMMNIEAVRSSKYGYLVCEQFLRRGEALMVIDESTCIKSVTASQSIACCKLAEFAPYRRILTGTPVTQSPLDYYGQFEFLMPGVLGHTSYYSFKARHCITQKIRPNDPKQKPFTKVLGYRQLDKLTGKVFTHASRALAKDCLDLPPQVFSEHYVTLTPEQAKLYREMKATWMAELANDQGIITAKNVLSLTMRLQQILCGYLPIAPDEFVEIKSNRPKELVSILDQNDEPSLVWCAFRHDVERLTQTLKDEGRNPLAIMGGMSNREKQDAVDHFQNTTEHDTLITTTHTLARVYTLNRATRSVFYSHNYDLELREQALKRNHRIGQTSRVLYTDIKTIGTVEGKILKCLKDKLDLATLVQDPKFGAAWIEDL